MRVYSYNVMGAFEYVSGGKISPITDSTEVFTISNASNMTLNETRKDVESQSSKPHGSRSLWWSLGVDLPLFITLLALIVLFEVNIIPTNKSGFYCNDPILSYPYKGETVGTGVLLSTLLLIPIVIAFPVEYIFADSDFSTVSKLRQATRNTMFLYRTYIFGLVLNLGVVEVMKGLMGGLRPSFFDVCEPDTAKTCNGSEYVSTFTCTSTKFSWWDQSDSYRSFPSGHSSLSVYCGFFMAWYLQRRAFDWGHKTVLLVPTLQLLSISYAAVCSLTRITDRRHHWWDVLVGAAIGLATVFYAAVALSDNFSSWSSKRTSDLKSPESQHTVRTLLYDHRREPITP